MNTHRSRLTVLLLALAVALAALLGAGAAARPADATPHRAPSTGTPTPRSTSTGMPSSGLALHDGATLAPPRILSIGSQPRDLTSVIKDLTGSTEPQNTHPPAPASPTPHPSSAEPGGTGRNSGSAIPSGARRPSSDTSAPAGTPSAEAPGATVSSPASTAPSAANRALQLRTVLGASALLAAAVTGVLAWRITRRRRRGAENAPGTQTSRAEALLSGGGEPDGTALLDTALRTLAHRTTQLPQESGLPAVYAARITADTVQVLPDDRSDEPREPFAAGKDGWWILPSDATLLDPDAARTVQAPYPALATLGTTDHGDQILLNLAHLPALLLDGDPAHVRQVCASLALELATSPWADSVDIITVGFADDLPDLLPHARITHQPDPAHALRDLSERLLEAHQAPPSQRQPAIVLLCASGLEGDTAGEFAQLLDTAGALPLTLVAPADTAAPYLPHAQILDATPGRPQRLSHLGLEITLQHLDRTAYQQITARLTEPAHSVQPAADGVREDRPDEHCHDHKPQPQTASGTASDPATQPESAPDTDLRSEVFPALLAGQTADPTPGPAPATYEKPPTANVPAGTNPAPADPPQHRDPHAAPPPPSAPHTAPPETATDQEGDNQAPQIRVLGPVEVDGIDTSGHGPRTAQLAALLYFKPGRSADALCTDMDPAHPWSTATLNARLQNLRSRLGNDPAGNPYVPRRNTGDAPYQLSPHIRCDWTHFVHLTQHALPQGPDGLPDLEHALTLVRGQPFGGRPLPWAEPYQQEMTTRIIDVAHTVATHRMTDGPHHDLNAARRAIARALDVDDSTEIIYRDWILIEQAAGNRQGVHTAITRIQHITRTLGCPLEPETQHLIDTALDPSHHDQAPLRSATP
ncbi:bacterial transcriptional activator domain-containing protein [Streptomyces sp. NPDC054837]